ncbi:hypothetical protein D3C80_1432450 [compost metagenome]
MFTMTLPGTKAEPAGMLSLRVTIAAILPEFCTCSMYRTFPPTVALDGLALLTIPMTGWKTGVVVILDCVMAVNAPEL